MAQTSPLSNLPMDDVKLPQEIEEGNVEYKLMLNPSAERLQHLITQMKWRIAEGNGEAIYEIGVSDNGKLIGLSKADMLQSISTLKEMAETLDADMTILRERIVNEDPERIVVEVLVRKCTEAQFLEIKIANLGAHDSGKSTLLGVLCHGELDNGRGKARLNTLRHYHEIASGRTSSISRQTIGFDTKGNLINYTSAQTSSTEHICEISSKLVTFLDLCGHPKYQKTTMRGLMGAAPDYTCLFVAANSGQLSDTSKDHLAFALTFSVFICITKIDVCSADQLKVTLNSLFKLLKAPGLNRIPLIIKDEDDAVTCVESFASSKIVPIFLLSSVTGENVQLLKSFLNLLPKPVKDLERLLDQELEYQIEEIYAVPDVGTVVAGMIMAGRMTLPATKTIEAFLGPFNGVFLPVRIQSIQRQRCPVKHAQVGQAASCAIVFPSANDESLLKPPSSFKLRKGQVILSSLPKKAFWEFEADLHVLHHTSPLLDGTQGVVYAGNVRQLVKILSIGRGSPPASPVHEQVENVDHLSSGLITGSNGRVKFRFLHEPEWLVVGRTFLFRGEGRMKCVGKIIKLE